MSTANILPTIAIFIPSCAIGGAEHYIKNILPLVVKSGFKPILVLPENNQVIDFYKDVEVEYITGDISWQGGEEDLRISRGYLHKLTKQYQEASKALEIIKPDSVFINLPWVDFGLGISLACHDLQFPCTNLIHLCPWRVDLNDLSKKLFQELAQANSYFYTVSNDNRIQLALSTGIDLDIIQVFYNSRDVENQYAGLTSNQYKLSRLELLEELGLPLNSFLSVSVGRFSHQKNFSDILTSFSSIHEKLPNYYHLFLGDGELKDGYQAIAEDLGISHKLKFLGYRKDVNRFLALSDLFISTSIYEGLALSILEAAQFGCPIIAADSSSAQEIIPSADYGLLYNPGQCYQLGKQIEFAYFNSEEMKQKAKNLELRCQEVFSSSKFEADLNNVLQHLLSQSKDFNYPDLSITFDSQAEILKVDRNFDILQYQYYGLPESIVGAENILTFPAVKYAEQALKQEHEKYLHCLHKIGKKLANFKTILCFGSFNPNFFRSYYLEENYLLLIISRSQSQSVTFGVHYIDHTYWGQELEPECLAKFTTFETGITPSNFINDLEKDSQTKHCYTSRSLLELYLKLQNSSTIDTLSLNLRLITNLFKPQQYYMLDQDIHGQKLKLNLINQGV